MHYGSFELSTESPDIALSRFRFRKGSRFAYLYDLGGLRECQKVWGNQAASCSASTDLSPAFSPGYHCSNFPRSVPSRVRVRACSMR